MYLGIRLANLPPPPPVTGGCDIRTVRARSLWFGGLLFLFLFSIFHFLFELFTGSFRVVLHSVLHGYAFRRVTVIFFLDVANGHCTTVYKALALDGFSPLIQVDGNVCDNAITKYFYGKSNRKCCCCL